MRPLVVIPTYNESENIRHLIPEVVAAAPELDVLVVDDESPDGTARLVRELMETQSSQRIFLESRNEKLGLGSAYVHGFKWGLKNGYDFLIEMDADWSHSPKYLRDMLEFSRGYDFVVGSRYVPGGGTLNWGWRRRMLSRFGSFYARLVLGIVIRDLTGGFNGWHAKVLDAICLDTVQSDGYSFQIELKYRASKLRFKGAEFPIVFEERRAGKSKMSGRIVLEAIWRLWQLRVREAGLLSSAAISPLRRVWSVIATLWLQLMVVVFVVVEIKRRVHTPALNWVTKIHHLLGI
jgi:dolichol-phosphate mannosyltransferase